MYGYSCQRKTREVSRDTDVEQNFRTDAAVAGAHVVFGTTAVSTDSSGRYSLQATAGEHHVSIDSESIGPVLLSDRTYRGDFYVQTTGCIARYGTVVDQRNRRPVAGATVAVGGAATTTDHAGWFRLSVGCPAVPCVGFNTTVLSISRPRYASEAFVIGRGFCAVYRVDYELRPG